MVAVSGGVDSVVMLDMLVRRGGRQLVVAHVDHGIRKQSAKDAAFVEDLARQLGLPFESVRLELGSSSSEEAARQARLLWLEAIRQKHNAAAIATAHHQDDVLETLAFNIVRGTGWRGLASLRESPRRRRPLRHMTKADIVRYAIDRQLKWREDSTNSDLRYSRNYLRHGLVARLPMATRQQLLHLADKQIALRQAIEEETARLQEPEGPIDRHRLIMVDDRVGEELLRAWLGKSYERPTLRRLLHFARTARPGKKFALGPNHFVVANSGELVVLAADD